MFISVTRQCTWSCGPMLITYCLATQNYYSKYVRVINVSGNLDSVDKLRFGRRVYKWDVRWRDVSSQCGRVLHPAFFMVGRYRASHLFETLDSGSRTHERFLHKNLTYFSDIKCNYQLRNVTSVFYSGQEVLCELNVWARRDMYLPMGFVRYWTTNYRNIKEEMTFELDCNGRYEYLK